MVALQSAELMPTPLRVRQPEIGALSFLGEFRRDPLALFSRIFREHGDFGRGRLFNQPIRFAFDPADVQRVLVDNVANYSKQTRGYAQLRLLLGNGLVTSEGSFWLRQRRIAQPAFARRRIAGFAETMLECTDAVMDRWQVAADQGQELDIAQEMMGLTLRIAGLTLLSRDLDGDAAEVGESLTTVMETFNHNVGSVIPYRWHLPTPMNLRARAARKRLDDIVYDVISERRAGEGGDDLLQMLLETEDEETGERMNDLQLRDEVMTMFLAGHETTANALTWTLTLLSEHPDVARKVEAELDTVLGDGPIDPMKARGLTYLGYVIKESMRLRPPVWAVGRRAVNDDVLHGETVKAGTMVFVSQHVTHRHPAHWENPEGFDPDRWAGDAPGARAKYAYFPFAGGPRQCIGKHFAEMEMTLLAATMLRKFRVSLSPGHPVVPQASVTLRPRYGVKARVSAR